MTKKTEFFTHVHDQPTYGAKVKYSKVPDETNQLRLKKLKIVQHILRTLLYYGIERNNTIITTLSTIALGKNKATNNMATNTTKILNYIATNTDAKNFFHARDIVLIFHSDDSYLYFGQDYIRVDGIHWLGSEPNQQNIDIILDQINGIISITWKVMHNIMASLVEAKLGDLLINC